MSQQNIGGSGNINVGGNYHQDNRTWHQNVDNRGGVYAGRDMVVQVPPELLRDLDHLSGLLGKLRLSEQERSAAASALGQARQAADQADPEGVGNHLHRFTRALVNAGAVAQAGTSLTDAIGRIATWLGPVGAAVLALL
ncbi:hypothetical protein [Alloactinosynnema sp. L-07]|uniref:hypothetical protein n=1 Tax=Alloactinosynnema sp. L-07 TaxID=1653480 RepID=UPI00065F03C4|nr:hypothetical protein [Alloactinosynnema sp. L-07]CRK60592.1 hypothetical protein [Alloactinosynnema sp. L-07]